MDAKVGDWVVTPRRGKAVEINALWYNALRLLQNWVHEEKGGAAAKPYGEKAERVKCAFNRRFWYAPGNYLYDVIDQRGDFYSCPVEKDARSTMNVVFTLKTPELEAEFLAEAQKRGMVGLKGHRSVGGMRASIYNAVPAEAVKSLADFMRGFKS